MTKREERLLLPKHLVAKIFGISVQAFTNWDVEPVEKRGREQLYYLPDVVQYRLERDTRDNLDLQAERARLAKWQADKTKIEVELLQGKVFKAEVVEAAWTDMIGNCRARLIVLPTRLAPILSTEQDQKKIENTIRDEIFDALNELKEYEPSQYNKSAAAAGNEDDSSAAETQPQPVG